MTGSVFPILIALAGVWLYYRRIRDQSHYVTVTGRGLSPNRIELGRMRPIATFVIAGFLLVAVILPVAILVYTSLSPYYAAPSREAFVRI